MSRMTRYAFALAAAFAFASTGYAAGELPTQSTSQSAVTVKVTPQNLQGATWNFAVVFDTHSQELKDDLKESAVLVTPDGKRFSPIAWQGDPPGGHHRKGVLRFDAVSPTPERIELLIHRPGEQQARSFRWVLK